MKPSQTIMKTPVELELQKLNIVRMAQNKNIEADYFLLKMLNSIMQLESDIVNTEVFQNVFNAFFNFETIQHLKYLPLFECFSFKLWNHQNYPFSIREKTSFYKIVSNWIVYFELRSGKLDTIQSQFQLIINFLAKETSTPMERIIVIQQIFQDLKDLIDAEFWNQEEQITINFNHNQTRRKTEIINQSQPEIHKPKINISTELNDIFNVIKLLELIISPQISQFGNKNQLYQNCTHEEMPLKNYSEFIKKCIYFCLSQDLPINTQNEITKIALIYLQTLKVNQSQQILNLLKHLMLRTTKAVRFALILQYVEFYEFLEGLGYEEVIEELQNMIYFRELIIGKNIIEESLKEIGNSINCLNLPFCQMLIKAGASKTVYFSNQQNQEAVLSLELILTENDINLKIVKFNNFTISKEVQGFKHIIFDSVAQLNKVDGTDLNNFKEQLYWKEQRSTSKKLELKLKQKGLYGLQFDNTYSWMVPKHVKYRLQIFKPAKRIGS